MPVHNVQTKPYNFQSLLEGGGQDELADQPVSDVMIVMGVVFQDGVMMPTLAKTDKVLSAEIASWCGAAYYQLQVFDMKSEAQISRENCHKWGSPTLTEISHLPEGGWALLSILPSTQGVSFEITDRRRCGGPMRVFPSWAMTHEEIAVRGTQAAPCPQKRAKLLFDVILSEAQTEETVRNIQELIAKEDQTNVCFGTVSIGDVIKQADLIVGKIGAMFSLSPALIRKRLEARVKLNRIDGPSLAREIAIELISEGAGRSVPIAS